MFSHKATEAKLVNAARSPYMLVTFRASTPPALWYYDLRKMKNTTITLKETGGEWEIGTIQGAGNFTPVAHFDEREDAEAALAIIQNAGMQKQLFPRIGPWTRLLLAIILGVFVFFLVLTPAPQGAPQGELQSALDPKTKLNIETGLGAEMNANGPQKIIPGVPMSADDVLVPPTD